MHTTEYYLTLNEGSSVIFKTLDKSGEIKRNKPDTETEI